MVQTLKPSNGFQSMSQTPDVNYNSYQVHNVNDNLVRSQFNQQTPIMDPLKGLQSSFQGNDNQFRTQNSLQASDVNTTNGFINNYIAPNVSRHNGNCDFLLLSSLIPIVKDKLAAITNSNNYRYIAISILVLKIFDWVIILAYNNYLKFDDLQFGYQPNVSTSMCTWIAVETISYFTRNGSDVFTCLMDVRKAFDTVQHSVLFSKLLEQGMPHILVRYLLTTYRLQRTNVKWNNEASYFFDIGKGF